MNRHAPEQDINEDDLEVHAPHKAAAGIKAVAVAYGADDRYRGISEGRRVILVHEGDLGELGFKDRNLVDVISTFRGANGATSERRADKFRLVACPTARGCAAAYFPEANALVHRGLVARESNTPGFKAMAVRFVKHGS